MVHKLFIATINECVVSSDQGQVKKGQLMFILHMVETVFSLKKKKHLQYKPIIIGQIALCTAHSIILYFGSYIGL